MGSRKAGKQEEIKAERQAAWQAGRDVERCQGRCQPGGRKEGRKKGRKADSQTGKQGEGSRRDLLTTDPCAPGLPGKPAGPLIP